MTKGDCVIVRENPHDRTLVGVVGYVRQVLPGAGIAGCDLLQVAYDDPITSKRCTRPFSPGMIEAATPERLRQHAAHLDRLAEALRRAAKSLS